MVTEFASAAEAAKKFGLGMSGVCCWCRNKGNAHGFWWRYHITKFDTPPKEKGYWEEAKNPTQASQYLVLSDGRVEGLDRDSGKHAVIVYDSGETEKMMLEQIDFGVEE